MTSRKEYCTQTPNKPSLFDVQNLRNHRTLDIGVLGYIGIVWPKEHSPEVRSFPPATSCIYEISSLRVNWLKATGCSDYCTHAQPSMINRTLTGLWQFCCILEMIERLDDWLCTTVHCLLMGTWGPKIVRVCVLKCYCDSDEVFVFVDLHCNNWITMHGKETLWVGGRQPTH